MSPLPRRGVLGALILLNLLGQVPAPAAVFTWTGATDGQWNTGSNWDAGVPPSAVDTTLVFNTPTQATTNHDIPAGLTVNALIIGADSGARDFSGNTLVFDGTSPALTLLSTTGDSFFSMDMVLHSTLSANGGPALSGQLLLGGSISGAGGIVFGSGFSVISGTNTFTGATTVGAGAVLGVAGGGLAATSGVTVEAGGHLRLIRVSSTVDTVVNRALSLAGTLSSTSPKRDFFGTPVTSTFWTGPVTLAGNSTLLAAGGDESTFGAVALQVSGTVDLNGHQLTLRTEGVNNEVVVTGAISGNGDVRILDTVDAGMVSLGALGGDGLLEVDFASSLGTATVTGNITGSRAIDLKNGYLTLSGSGNTFTGNIVSAGVLVASDSSRLGHASNTVTLKNGGAIELTATGTTSFERAIHLDAGGAILGPAFGFSSRTFTGNITGTGGLSVAFGGVTLAGNNTFTGGLRITGNTVTYANDANLGAAGEKIVLEGGQLNLPGSLTVFDRPVELLASPNPGILAAGIGQAVTLSGNITGSGGLRLDGRAIYTLTGNNTFTGRLTVLGNANLPTTIIAGSAANLGGADSPLTLGDQPNLNTRPVILQATGDLNFAATRNTTYRALTVDTNGHTVTFNQPLTGNGLTKLGAGTLLINNDANTMSGLLSLQAGVLGGSGTIGQVTIMNGAGLAPGENGLGLLTVSSNLSSVEGTFIFELGGTGRGTGYDALDVTSEFFMDSFGGNLLQLSFREGFQGSVQPTDTFFLITANTFIGSFGNVANGDRLFTTDGFGSFAVNYGAGSAFPTNSLVLSNYVAAVPEPATSVLAFTLVAASVVMLRQRRRPR